MKKPLGLLAFAILLLYGIPGCAAPPTTALDAPASATDSPSRSSPTIIEGTVVRVHTTSYLVRDQSGKELRVYFDQNTKQPDDIRRGEYIIVRFDGNPSTSSATSITRGSAGSTRAPAVSAPQTTAGPPGDSTTRSTQTFEGEVLRFSGDSYVIRDLTGKEVRLDVGRNTKIDNGVTTGNNVVAQTSSRPSNDVPYARQMYLLEGPKAIQGEVVRIERNIYVLRDIAGDEFRLYVDTHTLGDGNIKPGDKVFVLISQLPVVQPDSIIKR
jgi:uncharacterized protein YdeI (BOF family)